MLLNNPTRSYDSTSVTALNASATDDNGRYEAPSKDMQLSDSAKLKMNFMLNENKAIVNIIEGKYPNDLKFSIVQDSDFLELVPIPVDSYGRPLTYLTSFGAYIVVDRHNSEFQTLSLLLTMPSSGSSLVGPAAFHPNDLLLYLFDVINFTRACAGKDPLPLEEQPILAFLGHSKATEKRATTLLRLIQEQQGPNYLSPQQRLLKVNVEARRKAHAEATGGVFIPDGRIGNEERLLHDPFRFVCGVVWLVWFDVYESAS